MESGPAMNAEQISEQLYELKKSRIKTYPCNNLRASNLGHPCERYLYLLITQWQEQKPHDAGLQSIFDWGNHAEAFVISELKAAGFEVLTPTQRSWKIDNPLITGREDIRIKAEDGQLIPVEIKGLNQFEYDRLNCVQDFYKSKLQSVRGYPAQLQAYMYHFNKDYGFFVLLNKQTGQIKAIKMPFDWDYADTLLKKAERIYYCIASKEFPEATDDVSICERCSLCHICTAEHVRPETHIDDGEIEELILQRESLKESARKYDELGDRIKILATPHGSVLAGTYLVSTTERERKGYTVADSKYTVCTYKKLGV